MISLPSRINGESVASFLSRVPRQKDPERQTLLDSYLDALKTTPPRKCYYCDLEKFKSRVNYERHVLHNHNEKLAYPDSAYLKAMGLKRQGSLWEE